MYENYFAYLRLKSYQTDKQWYILFPKFGAIESLRVTGRKYFDFHQMGNGNVSAGRAEGMREQIGLLKSQRGEI